MSTAIAQSIPGAPPEGFHCAECGAKLQPGQFVEIDWPMWGGNPYPQPVLVCKNSECILAAEQAAQEASDELRQLPEYEDWARESEGSY
jgi:hypothetical protein